jgi:hypothetical protein
MYTCAASQLGDNLVSTRPNLKTARELIRLPTSEEICPTTLKAPGKLDAKPGASDDSSTTTDETTDETSTDSTTTDSTTSTDSTTTDSTTSTDDTAAGLSGSSTTTDAAP